MKNKLTFEKLDLGTRYSEDEMRQLLGGGGDIYAGDYGSATVVGYNGGWNYSGYTGIIISGGFTGIAPGFGTSGGTATGGGGNGGAGAGTGPGETGSGDNSLPPPVIPVNPLHPDLVNHLANAVNYANDLTQAQKDNYKKILNNIDSTKIGDKILTEIDKFITDNPSQKPTITDAPNILFNPNNNHLDLGNVLTDGYFDSYTTYTTAHEMYHEYEKITNQQISTNTNREVDAYMFATQVLKETKNDGFNTTYETNILSPNATTPAQVNFNNAWNSFVNGDYTSANYATIVNNFIDGSVVGSTYTINGQSLTPDPTKVPQFLIDLQQH